MEKSTWKVTIVTQICLCVALFVALNIGQPMKPTYKSKKSEGNSNDLYFISVGGGFLALKDQTHLLKLMGKVIKLYNAQFVVNLSELGEDDPLLQNDTSTGSGNDRLNCLTKPLQASNSDWRIVVGFQSLEGCDDSLDKMDLYHVFLKYGVDAYLSGQSCTKNVQKEGMAHIHNMSEMNRGPYFTSINEKRILHSDFENGFLLHRVSSLEIVTYLVTLEGEVVHQNSLRQGGRHVI